MQLNIRKISQYILFLFSISFAISCSKSEVKPNVVFFMVDDLGWRDLGCYGSDFYDTPIIDEFATHGVRFTDAYAACHVCSPTRASFITGKYPASINLTDWLPGRKDFAFQKLKNVEINQHLPYDLTTLPEKLKENGYRTAIFGKWHLGEDSMSTTRQGFDLHIPDWNKGWPNKGYHAPYGLERLEARSDDEYLTDRLTDEALNYIEENKDQPFFLYLSHFAVHDPVEGREDLVLKYKNKLDSVPLSPQSPFILEGNPDEINPVSYENTNGFNFDAIHEGYKVFPDNTVKIKQHQDNVEFAGMVESVDESLGKVINKLKELNIEEKTIIIFYSDNGGMSAANFYYPDRSIPEDQLDKAFSTSNVPLRGAKGWLYEGGIRVPLIIKWPGQGRKGKISNVPVTTPDFYPTICDMLHIDYNGIDLDGVSMVSSIASNKEIEPRAIFWHFPHYSNHGMQSPGGAVRYGDYKLLEYFENGSVQLFNLKEDIGELHDLSESHPGKVTELREMLHNWREQVNAKLMDPNPEFDEDARQLLFEEQ